MEIYVQNKKERRQIEVPADKSSTFIVDIRRYYLSANFFKTKLRNVTDKELLDGTYDSLFLTKL